jgi:TolB-like protein
MLVDLIAVAVALMAPLSALAAPRVAVLSPENRSGDPRYDYIGGIAYGLLLYDLSASGAVELVDRSAIDALLTERELSMSAIAASPERAFDGIASADWIIAGEYVLLGADLRLTLKVVDVSSSKVLTFSDAGSTENLIHALAESVVERLAGKRPLLKEEGRSRSILSLRDETPGTIALFSYLIDAKVYLDGEFIGYTTGDRRTPFLIEGVDPGVHELSTDLGADFGVVKLPEVTFSPWRELVRVQSGKRLTVTDKSTHFNDQLYRLMRVVRESPKVVFDAAGRYAVSYPFLFADRTGVQRKGNISAELGAPTGEAGTGTATVICEYEGERKSSNFQYSLGKEAGLEEIIGLAQFSVTVENSYGRVELDLEVERSDIRQGMHRGD